MTSLTGKIVPITGAALGLALLQHRVAAEALVKVEGRAEQT